MNNSRTTLEPIDRLRNAIAAIEADATRVELRAAILGAWAKPVPSYQPDDKFQLRKARNRIEKTASIGRRSEPR